LSARSRRNRAKRQGQPIAVRPSSYTGTAGATYTADQVAEMLAAERRGDRNQVAKMFGPGVPDAIRQAEGTQGMLPGSPFSPGEPIGPYDGFSRQPRTRDFVTGYNITTRPRIHERVSFDTLSGLIEAYDVAQMCCVPGTEIITKRGLVAIEDVVAGDEVITHLGRWRRVTQTMTNEPHTPVRVLKSGGFEDLAVTGNHPVYAIDYRVTQTRKREARAIGWISADKMRTRGPRVSHSYDALVLPALAVADSAPVLGVAEAVAAKTGDRFTVDSDGMLTRRLGGRLTRVPSQVKMNAALGRLLGWYMAEGSQGKARQVFFSLGPDEREHCEQILADAEAVFGLQGNIIPTQEGNGFQVRISSSALAALFSCGTARTKRLPEWAWGGGREFFAALLEAWATGDGCRSVRDEDWSARIMVITASRDLAWQMRMVAISLGHAASVVTSRNRDKYSASIRGRSVATAPTHYRVEWRENPQRWGRESFEFDGRYLATALVSAEESDYSGPVYNLEVEEDHSYTTTGGAVHNCIWHRIDTVRAVKYRLVPADGYNGDTEGAAEIARKVLRKPDRRHYFKNWLAKWLYDVLAYDAGTLYRLRNRGGRCIGLQPVDGTTIAPLLDYWGNEPEGDAPSHVQYVNGLPWNWLTRSDLVYESMRPVNKSIYGKAPIETIILSANTDIRFQLHFLQRFTDGNIPGAFAGAPESWTPDQIEAFQAYWDSFMYGDQTRKSQIRWLPGGSSIMWSNEKEFTDSFSLFLMRKCCAAFHVVPTDLGFTETANLSTGESQADVAHRIGELPLMEYVEEILSQLLYDDLQLPVKFEWDRGEDQDDRLVQAQADDIYIKNGTLGIEDAREMRYGLPKSAKPVPRFIFGERLGPVPLNALLAVAGPIDPETGAPTADAPLPHTAFTGVQGVIPDPPVLGTPLAVEEYGPAALPPVPPQQPGAPGAGPVAKEGETAGITAGTGIYGYDLDRDDDEDDTAQAAVAKELSAFRRYSRARRRAGEWRDFRFEHVAAGEARRLNEQGCASVRKDASGYDLSPRSGMISLDLPDGLISPVPGGVTGHHVTVVYLGPDVGDDAFAAACDRARQAAAAADGPLRGTVSGVGAFPPSKSSDGKVPVWAAIAVPGAERIREALADLSASEFTGWQPHVTLAYLEPGDPLPAPLDPVPVTFSCLSVHRGDQVVRYPLGRTTDDATDDATDQADGMTDVAKAGGAAPKRRGPAGR
jgi:hypothetical protein